MAEGLDRLVPGPHSSREGEHFAGDGPLLLAESRPPAALIRPAVDFLLDHGLAADAMEPAPEGSADGRAPSDAREIRFDAVESLPAQAYELSIGPKGIEVRASSRRGFLYGCVTLRQWLALHDAENGDRAIPGLEVGDRPDFARRGLLLDISRNKVPSMDTLMRLIDLCAELKLNELQLYMEHTFAYRGHEDVWRRASPLTADEIRQLDGYCRRRCVELVPNQNSFGHFHRWLIHERYRNLAECPGGVSHPFSERVEPFSLCPTDPASLDLLRDLYGQLLPNFTSGRFHVGFDETFEIGQGRSRQACDELGLAEVYFERLEAVRRLAAEHGRRIQIWADMLLEHRRLLARMPDDVTLCAWGYEAGHPFREDGAVLGASGCEVYLCPGTSSWTSFAGRAENALANLEEAAAGGLANGAAGYLITDWGDRGHLQPLCASYLGLVAGASFAWNRAHARRLMYEDWAMAIDRWVLGRPDGGLAEIAIDLADVYRVTGATQKNGTALFHLVMSPDDGLDNPRYRGLSQAGLGRAREILETALTRLGRSDARASEARRTRDELTWVAETLRLACDVGRARLDSPLSDLPGLPGPVRESLRERLADLADRRSRLWLERNRPGGMDESLHLFTRLARRLTPG